MMKPDLYYINAISRQASRQVFRSGYMRFFLFLAYAAVCFLHVNYHGSRLSGVTLSLTGTSSLIPYTNIYLFTLLLLVPVAFRVDSLLRKQKRYPDAVTRARPAGNDEYILGVTWGVLRVIFFTGAVSSCIAAVVNLFASNFPFNGWLYLFYFVTLLVPSFVFIVGMSLFTGVVVRHRGIGVLVLSGVLALSFFPPGHALDPLGITLAGAFSDVTGLAGMDYFIIQRFAWLLAGGGLVGFAIASFDRLPNSLRSPWRARGIASLLLLAGACCGACIVLSDARRSGKREMYAATYVKYHGGGSLTLSRQAIRCAFENETLRARSEMTVENQTTAAIERPLVYLNPSLHVSALRVNGEEVAFEREHQAVVISREALPGETWSVEMEYTGGIDESICYLDIPDEYLRVPFSHAYGDCRGGEKYAFLEENFVLLTPECLWYPVTLPPVNPSDVFDIQKDFTEYTLEVVTSAGNTVISQGERRVSGDTVSFRDDHPSRGLSLCIGPYTSYTV
ncbi:MAG: hypothetical protein LBF09_04715, partial [Odoribacteraceae bacterium]|nr:hypothetical protein [Odoribacteraceae bacterium]